MYESLDPVELLRWELRQQEESGHDARAVDLPGLLARARGRRWDDPVVDDAFAALGALPVRADWSHVEPDGLGPIEAECDWPAAPVDLPVLDEAFTIAVRAAWTGRIAGNMLGKPVENGDTWTPQLLQAHLRAHDAWPLRDYFPPHPPAPPLPAYRDNWVETTAGRVDGSSRDDDVDYTILGLRLLRRAGTGFTTADVAQAWLELLPVLQTYTAERAVMRNLAAGVAVEAAATHRNPYREWIGAAIRADVLGMVRPGDPGAAARLAHRDAVLSHTGNGVYAAMWCAALVAAAFGAASAREALEASLAVVPARSRLRAAIDLVRSSVDAGEDWATARRRIDADLGHYGWVHAVPNAAVLTAGLLHGDGDFTRSIALTVCGGLDTDSNGATAGAVAGVIAGEGGIAAHWSEPLHDRVRTAVFGDDGASISSLAAQTVEVARAARRGDAPVAPRPDPSLAHGW